jgi:predicted P-loop ATPase
MSKKANIDEIETYISENYDLRYNVISNDFEYKTKDSETFETMNENNIRRKLLHNNYSVSDALLKTILKSDFVDKHNPIKEYFETLEIWDGKTDYISLLSEYIVVNPNERESFKTQLKKALIRSIACSLEVHVNKQCFVIVHKKQNSGKTTFIRWLCPPALKNYYTELMENNKDGETTLAANFMINLDELASLEKQEVNKLKAVMSRDTAKLRLPFDARFSTLKRRANFWASTNKTEFLTDETGNVRWVCFNIQNINHDYSKDIDINDIWAQAYTMFKNEEKYLLTPEEIAENEARNRKFIVNTPEIDILPMYFKPAKKDDYGVKFYSASEIVNEISKKTNIKLYEGKMGKALQLHDFERVQGYYIGTTIQRYGYYVIEISNTNPF